MADRWRALNRIAIGISLALLAALAVLWQLDRRRVHTTPRWEPERFESVRAPSPEPAPGERWFVVVQPDCDHCTEHLRWLASRLASRERSGAPAHEPSAVPPPSHSDAPSSDRTPALGVLLVDVSARPARDPIDVDAPAGVWWDSAQVWREQWGRRAYGETFRFAADGRLLGSSPPMVMPDSSTGR